MDDSRIHEQHISFGASQAEIIDPRKQGARKEESFFTNSSVNNQVNNKFESQSALDKIRQFNSEKKLTGLDDRVRLSLPSSDVSMANFKGAKKFAKFVRPDQGEG